MEMLPLPSTTTPVRVEIDRPLTSMIPFPAEDPFGTITVAPGVTWSPTVADIGMATGRPPINGTEPYGGDNLQKPALVDPLVFL